MLWDAFFRVAYRLIRLADPIIRAAWRARLPGLGRIVDLHVPGSRSGRGRRVLVTLLEADGRHYVGHPNGMAAWARSVDAAGRVEVFRPGSAAAESFRAIRLHGGPEFDAVVRATWSQQPFPSNLVYALARRHVRSVGAYFRLTPDRSPEADGPATPTRL